MERSSFKTYGILAYPAKHSLSPAMHNAAFQAIGFEGEYTFFEVKPEELVEFIEKFRKDSSMQGLSVSLPHKETILELIDDVNGHAKKIGAVNTVVKENGRLVGYNTDYLGFVRSMEEVGGVKNKNFVVYGAGGAARAIVYGILEGGGKVLSILNRTVSKAEEMAEEFSKMFGVKIDSGPLSMVNQEAEYSDALLVDKAVLVQTTSIWTLQPGSAKEVEKMFNPLFIDGFSTVVDIAYKPLITPLLAMAKEAGCQIVTGEKMLLYQAVEQFELWTGKKAPVEAMRKTLVVS